MKTKLFLIGLCLGTYFVSQAQTTFADKQPINTATGDAPFVIDSGHLDADTFVDIVIGTNLGDTVEWYKNNGDGTFTLQTLISSTMEECGGVLIADLNNDGFNDVLASNFANDKLVWFANDGSGNFGTEQVISSAINGSSGIVTGFIDAGTTVDVAVVGFASGDTVWFSNDGSGTFTGPNTVASVPGSGPGTLDLEDFDGDGDNDIVILNSGGGSVELYYNDLIPGGSVSFTKDVNTVTSGEVYPFDVKFADVDGDTNLDIIAVDLFGGASGLGWYKKEMDGTFSETIISNTVGNPSNTDFEDLDNDGLRDIILTSGTSGTGKDIVWFRNLGGGTYDAEQVIDDTQSQAYAFTVNDFDNDGDKDISSIAFNDDDLNWFENELITLGLNTQTIETIKMYPNPASSVLNFKGIISEAVEVTVFDILGKEIMSVDMGSSLTLDVSNLENGTYILKFKDSDSVLKFVKE